MNRHADILAVTPELRRVGLTVVLLVLLVAQVLATNGVVPGTLPLWGALLAATCAVAPLATVSRWPFPSLTLMCAATALLGATEPIAALLWIAPTVAVYITSNRFGRRAGVAAAIAVAIAVAVPTNSDLTALGAIVNVLRALALTAAAAAFGEAVRARREQAAEAAARALEAEAGREARAALAVDEERLRIARELHDVTAHALSVVAIQSELARRTLRSDPHASESALGAIGHSSRQALGELRAMLGRLRGDEATHVGPSPSLGGLGEVLRQMEAAGVDAEVSAPADVADLPPFVDSNAFRIIQEAVTNVIRHARASRARIEIERSPEELRLRVADDGPASAELYAEGHGIIGMRERAASVGGTLEVGPDEHGGWRVEARLPLPAQDDGRSG